MKKVLTILICILFIGLAGVAVLTNHNNNSSDNKTIDKADSSDGSATAATKPEYYNADKIEIIDDNTAIIPDGNIKSMHQTIEYSNLDDYEFTVDKVYYDNNIRDIIKERTINYESNLSSLCSVKRKEPYREYIDENGNLDGENYTFMYVEITIKNIGDNRTRITPLSYDVADIDGNKVSLKSATETRAAFVAELDDKEYLDYMLTIQMDKGESIKYVMVYPIATSSIDSTVLFRGTGNGKANFSNSIYYIRLRED